MLDRSLVAAFLQSTAGDWLIIISLVFGGCCSNVWALEGVLQNHPKSGTFLTFSQFVYVAFQNLSGQVDIAQSKSGLPYPRLKSRNVPIKRWFAQVLLFFAVNLMNNYAFGLKIPVTVHIIFRSGGLCVSMIVGRIVGKRRYSVGQMLAGLMITSGIVLATLSAPNRRSPPPPNDDVHTTSPGSTAGPWITENGEYLAGIGILAAALVLSALLGLYQEQTYKMYGRQWKEALFYCHFLSLPLFLPFSTDLIQTFSAYAASPALTLLSLPRPSPSNVLSLLADPPSIAASWKERLDWHDIIVPSAIFALALNIFTQGLCVRGVNRLTTRVSAVTVNLVLTVRKAVSLGISVWYYGSGATPGLIVGGGMVLLGTILYTLAPGQKGVPVSTTAPKSIQPTPAPIDADGLSRDNGQSEQINVGTGLGADIGADPLASSGLRLRQSTAEDSLVKNHQS